MKTTTALLTTAAVSLALAGAAQAATTVNFTDLNTVATGNTLKAGGSTTGVVVTRTAPGNNFNYAVIYTTTIEGIATVLNFNVLVEGLSGTVADGGATPPSNFAPTSDASATIGSTDAGVMFGNDNTADAWTVGEGPSGDSDRFLSGETLKFTITGLTSSVGTAEFTGFTAIRMQEWTGNSHQFVIGAGEDTLDAYFENNSLNVTLNENPALYVSSLVTANNALGDFGFTNLGFNIAVTVPEPTSGLLVVSSLALLALRRRRN